MTKRTKQLLSGILSAALIFSMTPWSTTPTSEAAQSSPAAVSRVSVHDPSIVKGEDGTYYVFGSHLADAKSSDLMTWTQMNADWNFRGGNGTLWQNDSVYGEILTNLSESFEWAGYNDGDSTNGLGVWAPDVKYNPDYVWEDSSKGAYMLYYSASSTWRRSCIGYAVSKDIEGPYEYVDTIIYSGFTKTGETDGNSTRNTKWDNDYLHFNELIDSGTIEGVSDNWFTAAGGWNANYAPNAIDPTIFYSKDGNMYMVYGSWSGGLFILEIDPATGQPKYPGADSTDATSGNFIDRYFGVHIAGGNRQSGEGAYILYDEESDYYYLYETYGGLTSTGGYNMRLFRSKNVYGPYTDAAGRNAANSGSNNDSYGIKLIGNYAFGDEDGYRAAGHNSAFIDDDGQRYLIYHQRFNQPSNQSEYHEVRVRKQFLSEDGWPITSVYEYRGEEIGHYEASEVVGTYEIVNHGTSTDGNMISSQTIELFSNGTVAGAYYGTWEKSTGDGKEYDYITLTLDGITYKGILYKQFNEENTPENVMTFSAVGNDNTCVWATRTGDVTSAEPTATPIPAKSYTIGDFRSNGTEKITHSGDFEATYTFTNKSTDNTQIWHNFIVEVADSNNSNTNICVRADNWVLNAAGGTSTNLGTWSDGYVANTWQQNMYTGSECQVKVTRSGTDFTFDITAGGSTISGTVSAPSLTGEVTLRLTGEKVILSDVSYTEKTGTSIPSFDTSAIRTDSATGNFDTTYTFYNVSNGSDVWDNYLVELKNADSTKGMVIRADNYGWTWESGYDNVPISTKEITGTYDSDKMKSGAFCSIHMVRNGNTYTITTDDSSCQITYTVTSDLGDTVTMSLGGEEVTLSDVAKDGIYDLAEYRKSTYCYPNSRDKIFAGWYTDSTCKTPITTSVKSGDAYAKFVDASLLTAKYQFTAGATEESESLNIRLMLGVDSLDYDSVGFKISYNEGAERDYNTNVVYSGIKVTTGNETNTELPSTFFGETATYMLPYVLKNVKQANYNKIFRVTPYWVTLDGTTVTGSERAFTVNSTFSES